MAKEPSKRQGGIFGGKGSLKEDLQDISGDDKITFADTWLGDLLGFDGDFGVQGAGLRESWFGARRDGPGSKANKPNMSDAGTGGPRRGGPRRDIDISLEEISESGSGMDIPEYSEEDYTAGTGGPRRGGLPRRGIETVAGTGGPRRGGLRRAIEEILDEEATDEPAKPDSIVKRPEPKVEKKVEKPTTVEGILASDRSVDDKLSLLIGNMRSLTKEKLEEITKEVNKLPDSFDKRNLLSRLKTLKGIAK